MVDFEKNKILYQKMHNNLISQLENKEFNLFLSTRNDLWNVIWIYNLNKQFTAQEYNQNYIIKV